MRSMSAKIKSFNESVNRTNQIVLGHVVVTFYVAIKVAQQALNIVADTGPAGGGLNGLNWGPNRFLKNNPKQSSRTYRH
jgi:hypothetical protein